ncbi:MULTISPECIES: cytochrome c3 family protein [unclassified Pseudodesulfovibrio]|uniref:cytochrome c3 family protein n=1 Tax=unclassified Pseudodesulfovibrio TaxID=2661612 RepID=UPI000FEBB41C|nr:MULTISPECIES: cytochrome c3 family protein [unclassified Pseudodesulfovibrio]MCJ2163267.1 cytochrome c3 family protein [Pseudodesulfovibrio sp. S3-i]RWU07248.1 cytochrome C [Pseudodesulfovibrio sp. S3]
MHRFTTITLTICTLLLGASLAAAAPKAPGELKLGPPDGIAATKTHVTFSHAKHDAAKVECVTCHHTWDGTSDIKQCSTSGCHDQPGKKDARAFYTAFHSKKTENSCLGCHKIVKKNGKPVPVSCGSCHPK